MASGRVPYMIPTELADGTLIRRRVVNGRIFDTFVQDSEDEEEDDHSEDRSSARMLADRLLMEIHCIGLEFIVMEHIRSVREHYRTPNVSREPFEADHSEGISCTRTFVARSIMEINSIIMEHNRLVLELDRSVREHYRTPNGPREPLESDLIPAIDEFVPPRPTDTPRTLFRPFQRFMRRGDGTEILIYTDGACPDNGLANARGGCGFVISPNKKFNIRLENKGPTGEPHAQTNNRAELRAVIAALEYRGWIDGIPAPLSHIVIATDSEYVVLGATQRIQNWIAQGWRTNSGSPVKNQDLWKRLIYQIRELDRERSYPDSPYGIAVSFWRIPREWNAEADAEAKKGADLEEVQRYTKALGVIGM